MFPKVDRKPAATNWGRGQIASIPTYNGNPSLWQVDLRAYDLSSLDLSQSLDSLWHADFDTLTKWPAAGKMPKGYVWKRIMDLGKNPGLGVRQLHKMGITGRGVGIAIIDQPLLVTHQEYGDRLQLYEEISTLR